MRSLRSTRNGIEPSEGGALVEAKALYRGYEIWRHARDRATANATDLDRIDVIGALRRAVNHRLKAIRAAYNFECLPSTLGKRQILERLHEFGIVRSSLIKDLLDVRNFIEHDDFDPPDLEKCRHFVDITWYFLKSTDKLLDVRVDRIVFSHDDGKQLVGVSIDHERNWNITIQGTVQPILILNEATLESIILTEFTQKPSRKGKELVSFAGAAQLVGVKLTSLARASFGAAGYWYDDGDA